MEVHYWNDVTSDANFVAYVVLFWPWSSDMDNSSSQVYDERKIQADYLVSEFVSRCYFPHSTCAQLLLLVQFITFFNSFFLSSNP